MEIVVQLDNKVNAHQHRCTLAMRSAAQMAASRT